MLQELRLWVYNLLIGLAVTPTLGYLTSVGVVRISVALLLELLACGMTIPEIVQEYPSLSEEAIRGVLEELAHSDLLVASR
ncbi:MAG: DUF433 domain-containing protein [Candidatus Caldarchaeum sp.]